ncbi:MAG: two-component system sensor histidine kinase CreC, partial [Lysobacter sp.]
MKIGLRIFLGYFFIVALAALLLAQVFVAQVKPGVRQAMEDTLVDTANVLAELATEDLLAGRIADGTFARRVRGLRGRDFGADIWGFDKRGSNYRIYVTDARGIVVFDSAGKDVGKNYSRWNDVYLTLRGRYGARSTAIDPADKDSTVMHVAAPIRNASGTIVGVLTVAKPNRTLAPFIARSQGVVMRWGGVLMGVALLVGLIAAWWLSQQLSRLQRYAHAVTAGERVALPNTAGEFGELGQALETMRAKLEGKQYVEGYVHALTHEMKSPLAAIRGSAELLESPLPEADRLRFASSIRLQTERLAQMIDKLLALAAVEHRQRIDNPERVDLRALAREAAEQCA